MAVKPIPDWYRGVIAYLAVSDAAQAIDFYKNALGAVEVMRISGPGGGVAHAEVQVGEGRLMLADEVPAIGHRGPLALGGTPVAFMIYVEDVDAAFNRAVAAGAKVERPVSDQFYGDRVGAIIDPFGHKWFFASRKEEVSPAEMQKRMDAMVKQPAPATA
jgi:PhnB protein